MRCLLCNELLTDHDIQQAESADVQSDHVACEDCLHDKLCLDFNIDQGYADPCLRSEEV